MPAIYNSRYPNRIPAERLTMPPLPEPKPHLAPVSRPAPAPRPPVVRRPAPPKVAMRRPYRLPQEFDPKRIASRATLGRLMEMVAEVSGIGTGDLYGPRRLKPIARARHLFWFVAKREYSLTSMAEIARFSGKDHTSVMHGLQRAKRFLRDQDPDWVELLDRIDAALRPEAPA